MLLTRAEQAASIISANINGLLTGGVNAVGDGPLMAWSRAASTPAHALKFQSADAAYWERTGIPRVHLAETGCKLDGTGDVAAAIADVASYLSGKFQRGIIDVTGVWGGRLDSPITITSNDIVIRGDFWGSSSFRRNHDQGPLFTFQSPNPSTAPLARSGLVNVWLMDNNNVGTFGNSPFGVKFDHVLEPAFEGIRMVDEAAALYSCIALRAGLPVAIEYAGKAYNSGRILMHVAGSQFANAKYPFGGNINFAQLSLSGGITAEGAVVPKAAEGLRVECCDGLFVEKLYSGMTGYANVRVKRSDSAKKLDNLEVRGFLDICSGYSFLLDGAYAVNRVKIDATVSQLVLGSTGVPAVAVLGPCNVLDLLGSIEGAKGHGAIVDHPDAVDVTIALRSVRNVDADEDGGGVGAYLKRGTRGAVQGGRYGGDGTMQVAAQIGSAFVEGKVQAITASDCDLAGVVVENGAVLASVLGCDLKKNPTPLLDQNTRTDKNYIGNTGVTDVRSP